MKKVLRSSLLFVMCFLSLLTFVGCVSQSYADKVNKAAEAKENLTFEQVTKDLGDPTIDARVLGSGVCTWIKGVSKEKFAKMTDDFIKNGNADAYKGANGKDCLIITFTGGKATSATFSKYEKDAKK